MPNFSVGSSQTGSATFTDPVTQGGAVKGFFYDFSSFSGPGTGTVTLEDGVGDLLTFNLLNPIGYFATPNATLSFTLQADINVIGAPSRATTLPNFTLTASTADIPEPATAFLIGIPLIVLSLGSHRKGRKSRQS